MTEGGATTSFVYDADGNRLLRLEQGGIGTLFMHDGQEIRAGAGGSKTATRYYMHDGQVIGMRTAAGVTWLAGDHHGTGELAVDAATQAVTKRRTKPFGEPRGPATTWPNDKGFVGGTIDEIGTTHLGAREYDPVTGRFASVDPVVDTNDPQQMHGYAYANNSPVSMSDPDGLKVCGDDECSESATPAVGGGYIVTDRHGDKYRVKNGKVHRTHKTHRPPKDPCAGLSGWEVAMCRKYVYDHDACNFLIGWERRGCSSQPGPDDAPTPEHPEGTEKSGGCPWWTVVNPWCQVLKRTSLGMVAFCSGMGGQFMMQAAGGEVCLGLDKHGAGLYDGYQVGTGSGAAISGGLGIRFSSGDVHHHVAHEGTYGKGEIEDEFGLEGTLEYPDGAGTTTGLDVNAGMGAGYSIGVAKYFPLGYWHIW